jgi:putative addiction module antidote
MIPLKLTQVGNSLGVILPKEIIAKLRVEKGDEIYWSDTPGGGRITANNPEFAEQMKLARAIMKKRRNALHELAK